ncbi:MAG TPA: UDPGP type 1 family protein [Tepidisphaeraceae bacterium]|jgi:UDP-N-acetylglucosamine/UDP-N-acetylgalactosamine diphosphorylase
MTSKPDYRLELEKIGQTELLRHLSTVSHLESKKIYDQVSSLDLPMIGKLIKEHVKQKSHIALPSKIDPVKIYPRQPGAEHAELYRKAKARGEQLVKEGKVAAFVVAGGQGTRLGYDGPKGEFPVTPIKKKSLFQFFAEQILGAGRDAGHAVPWYIMTSDVNDAATRDYFKRNNYFGLSSSDVYFFEQGMMPAFSFDGQMLLSAPDSLALVPDGHGGSLRAIARSGALADMQKRGIAHLSYFQVDNPLVHTVDPLFIGLHDLTGSEMSSKTIPKSNPLEKVGNFVFGDGKLQVIEYSDLPEELARKTNPDGSRVFDAGSIGIHALRVDFIARLNSGELSLPWHRAEKKVAFVDQNGKLVEPTKPNAVKLEQFVFDAIPLAHNPILYETERGEEFSGVKNAQGVDSPATCSRDQIRRAAKWLKSAGISVPMNGEDVNATLEISPLLANSAEDLQKRPPQRKRVEPGETVYFE